VLRTDVKGDKINYYILTQNPQGRVGSFRIGFNRRGYIFPFLTLTVLMLATPGWTFKKRIKYLILSGIVLAIGFVFVLTYEVLVYFYTKGFKFVEFGLAEKILGLDLILGLESLALSLSGQVLPVLIWFVFSFKTIFSFRKTAKT
jgi:hypothetical protein